MSRLVAQHILDTSRRRISTGVCHRHQQQYSTAALLLDRRTVVQLDVLDRHPPRRHTRPHHQQYQHHNHHHHYQRVIQRGIACAVPGYYKLTANNRSSHFFLDPTASAFPSNRIQHRTVSSWLPEVVQNFSIWGYSGSLLKAIHLSTGLPYWACFASISVGVRTLLFPLVLYAAHTAARFAKIAPDVQFQVALFQRDMKHYREMRAKLPQILFLMRTNLTTLASTYKLHQIHPFSIFLSPLCQIPILWYISIDLRKIVNGLDPVLAQALVDSPFAWVPDLTEPDPWYGLPVLAGMLLYGNMEVALGRRSMAGETASKADTSKLLKDLFQSFAVFMPCFTAQLPGGVQVYLVTSFCFTLVQSAALRTEAFRRVVGLPSMQLPPDQQTAGKFTTQMLELKKLEQRARELRGDGPVLGKGSVLMYGWELSFPGRRRPSSIRGSDPDTLAAKSDEPVLPFVIQPYAAAANANTAAAAASPSMTTGMLNPSSSSSSSSSNINYGPYAYGVSAPPWQLEQQRHLFMEEEKEPPKMGEQQQQQSSSVFASDTTSSTDDQREYLPQFDDDAMEKANRGESPHPPVIDDDFAARKTTTSTAPKLNVKRLLHQRKRAKGKRSPSRRR